MKHLSSELQKLGYGADLGVVGGCICVQVIMANYVAKGLTF